MGPDETAADTLTDTVFEALSDPMRRRLLAELSARPATATELSAALPITRQAVSKHLGALSRAGLLARERSGRDVRYRVTPEPLTGAVAWMTRVGEDWDERLRRLQASAARPASGSPGPRRA